MRHTGRTCAAVVAVLVASLAGCSDAGAPAGRLEPAATGTTVEEGIPYSTGPAGDLLLDACLPAAPEGPVPVVVVVHGGGFTSGDRETGGSRGICELAASMGAAGFSIDYRLAPAATWPAPVDDVGAAVRWLREPAQVERFGLDPARVALVGSSAGAVLAQSLATRGSGPPDTGERVAAVVSLSGVSVMTPEALGAGTPSTQAVQLVLTYLGCTSVTACPQGQAASPVTAVDPTDPPMLLVNGTDELVPDEQARAMAGALEAADVPVDLVLVDGSDHGTALLDADVRRRVLTFLEEHL
ncbi:alpha/beta hydrolase [Geodermatophilus sp. FMUSA9-8]|uniref:alpha/beta hydrolase n=1 Tax=Geodermatophilus sp. FMUSA9-8 TaxID=3120155 RepID=UPI00300938E3